MAGRASRPLKTLSRWSGLLLAAILYLSLSLPNLSLPGLYDDEALSATRAHEAVRAVQSGTWSEFPLIISEYHGPLSAYLSIPYTLLFSRDVALFRLQYVVIGLIILLLVYLLCLIVFDDTISAGVAVLLLSTHASFILGCRDGADFAVLLPLLELLCLISAVSWGRTRRRIFWFSSFFCMGLCLATQAYSIFLLTANLALGIYLLKPIRDRMIDGGESLLSYMGLALLGVFMGSLPLTLYYLLTPVETSLRWLQKWPHLIQALGNPGGNVWRWERVLDGTLFPEIHLGINEHLGTDLFPPRKFFIRSFYAACLTLPFFALSKRDPRSSQIARALLLWGSVYFAVSFITVSSWSPSHISSILPFSTMVVAFSLTAAARRAPWKASLSGTVILLFVLLNSAADTYKMLDYHRTLRHTGGRGFYSSATDDLARWLDQNEVRHIYSLHWGLHHTIPFLTGFKTSVTLLEKPALLPEAVNTFPIRVAAYRAGDPWRAREQDASFRLFIDGTRRNGIRVTLEQSFHQRDGLLSLQIYRCERRSPISGV
ncbi:MAG TPA: hypothetical protein PK876_02265 [Elusimicrobiota bacterium]|nr:hypothetical protein [Elusimicrobiota bacterium]